jgi:transcriptional regulator with XRE-family HTH domain
MNVSESESLGDRLAEEFADKEYAHEYVEEFLNTYLATQIKVLREQRGLSQSELAALTDMKQARISVLENVNYGSWSINTLKRLAQAFDLTLSVSFEEFTSKIKEIESFSRQALERQSRDADLAGAFSANQEAINSGVLIDMMKWQQQKRSRGDDTGGLTQAHAGGAAFVDVENDPRSGSPSVAGAQGALWSALNSAAGGAR